MEHDTVLLAIDEELEKLGTPEARLFAQALRIIVGSIDADRARVRAIELAVAELGRHVPVPGAKRKTLFGISVVFAPGVDDDAVRAALEELPAGLGAKQVVAELEERGLLLAGTG